MATSGRELLVLCQSFARLCVDPGTRFPWLHRIGRAATGEGVEPENDEADYDGKSTVILTLNSSAYLILFGVLPGSH